MTREAATGRTASSGRGAGSRTASGRTGFYHVTGTKIYDHLGNEIRWHGVNTFVRLNNERAKFQAIKDYGFDSVRLALHKVDILTPVPSAGQDRTGLMALDRAIEWAGEAGLKVILDQHTWDTTTPSAPQAFTTDAALQAEWIAMWHTLIERYRYNSTVIGCDMMNEPFLIAANGQSDATRSAAMETLLKSTILDLQGHRPELLYIVEVWPNIGWTDKAWLAANKVIYSEHIYRAENFPWGASYEAGSLATAKTQLEDWMEVRLDPHQAAGACVWVGEFGEVETSANEGQQITDICDLLEGRNMGYSMYVFAVTDWVTDYNDIVSKDTPYDLTALGTVYSNYVLAL
jgi:endoglucanase